METKTILHNKNQYNTPFLNLEIVLRSMFLKGYYKQFGTKLPS